MFSKIKRFLESEDGPTAVEYAVMLSLIIAVCLIAIQSVGSGTAALLDNSSAELDSYLNEE